MSNFAIVFINLGLSDHLLYALAQAKRLNPEIPVILLCDLPLPPGFEYINYYSIQDYSDSARDFALIYRYFSVNNFGHELICMQRWFILRDFLRAYPDLKVLHLDSDVLLFSKIATVLPMFECCEFAISGISPHTMFLSLQVAEELCALMTGYYANTNSDIVDVITSDIQRHAPDGPSERYNICDMVFLQYYRDNTQRSWLDIFGIYRELGLPFIFDHNVNSTDVGFDMSFGFKKIEWIDGAPYGCLTDTGERVRFCSLHYQGLAKRLMPEHFSKTGDGCLAL